MRKRGRQRKPSPVFLEGNRVYLRPLRESDVDGPYVNWLNDEAVCRGNSHHVYPYPREKALEYIRRTAGSDSSIVLAVVLKDGDAHVGNVALQRIHWVYRCAEFAVLLGEKAHWGKGYSLEAGRLLFGHGFSALNLNRIECATFETNSAMRKLARALGMKEEGVRRKAAHKDGKYLDIVEFGLLRKEFENKAKRT